MPGEGSAILVGGPYFEDFKVGQVFDDAPALTITTGHAAWYQALFGDRLRLPLDGELSSAVTGRAEQLVHPNLVTNIGIGQTTGPSQRVRGNLFYRGLILLRPVFIGETLRTSTEIVGLKQNRTKPGKPSTGLVAMRIHTVNQAGVPVLDFWRCPMIPLRDPAAETGHADSFDAIPAELDMTDVLAAVPKGWHLDDFRRSTKQELGAPELLIGTTFEIEGRDTVTSAPEFARLTLNMAQTHTDEHASAYGRRLVYGGHTISMASAQIVRAFPNLVTILAWRSCDHTGPVFEGDVLRTEVTVDAIHDAGDGSSLLDMHAIVHADRRGSGGGSGEEAVLDWRFIALAT